MSHTDHQLTVIDDVISDIQKFPLQTLNWNITGPHPSFFQLFHCKCSTCKLNSRYFDCYPIIFFVFFFTDVRVQSWQSNLGRTRPAKAAQTLPHQLSHSSRTGLPHCKDPRQLHDRFRRLFPPSQRRGSLPRWQAVFLPPRLSRLGKRKSFGAFTARATLPEKFWTLRTYSIGPEEEHVAHFRRLSRSCQFGRSSLHLSFCTGYDRQ